MTQWAIESESTREARHREALGDAEYERRKAVAAEKCEAFPESEWNAQMVIGGQFEAIAMQASQEIFDKLEKLDFRFWERLTRKIIG